MRMKGELLSEVQPHANGVVGIHVGIMYHVLLSRAVCISITFVFTFNHLYPIKPIDLLRSLLAS